MKIKILKVLGFTMFLVGLLQFNGQNINNLIVSFLMCGYGLNVLLTDVQSEIVSRTEAFRNYFLVFGGLLFILKLIFLG